MSAEAAMLISAADLARMLRVSSRTVARLSASGALPKPVRLGRSVRWNCDEIERWKNAGCPSRQEWEARKQANGNCTESDAP